MNILFIEPFYSGSHKQFADQLQKHSSHNIQLLTLEGKFWKWRLYGAALTLGQMFLSLDFKPDLMLVTDMLDLPLFLSIIRNDPRSSCKVGLYFHENQLTYPWKEDSEDVKENRDVHYGMMNYNSALVADFIWFNSTYNMNSMYEALRHLLRKMPDHRHNTIEVLKAKSKVMPLGLELKGLVSATNKDKKKPLILWNHRWEHDKNPDDFFKALQHLQDKKVDFSLALLGETYKSMPESFKTAKITFAKELIHYGYAPYELYKSLLNVADVLPVTSKHDFFGISVMEGIHCGAYPLLPIRLSYIELYDPSTNPDIFYKNQDELNEKLYNFCSTYPPSNPITYTHITKAYDWSEMISIYDQQFRTK